MVDVLTPEQRKRCMSSVKNKGTSIELELRKALWSEGLRYRLKSKLLGKPDLVFVSSKVVVFVDGCFWHGCPIHGETPDTNSDFWRKKISGNVERDDFVSRSLIDQGWEVLRFWEHEIGSDLEGCVAKILKAVRNSKG